MKALFIGGTGTISTDVVELAQQSTVELPFNITFTPINGSCFESVTVPVIVLFCAYIH